MDWDPPPTALSTDNGSLHAVPMEEAPRSARVPSDLEELDLSTYRELVRAEEKGAYAQVRRLAQAGLSERLLLESVSHAIAAGNLPLLEALLGRDSPQATKDAAFRLAARQGTAAMVSCLLSLGVDAIAQEETFSSAISPNGLAQVASALLAHAPREEGLCDRYLELAVDANSLYAVRDVLARCATPPRTRNDTFRVATDQEKILAACALLESGIDQRVKDEVFESAIVYGSRALFSILISNGISTGVRDEALQELMAIESTLPESDSASVDAESLDYEIVELSSDSDSDSEEEDEPRRREIDQDDYDMVETLELGKLAVLLGSGISRTAKERALKYGVERCSPRVLKAVLEDGVAVDSKKSPIRWLDALGIRRLPHSYLGTAVSYEAKEAAIRHGLQHGRAENLAVVVKSGLTSKGKLRVLRHAMVHGTAENFKAMLSADFSPSLREDALIYGIEHGTTENFKVLLEDGIASDAKDRILMLAEVADRSGWIEYLLKVSKLTMNKDNVYLKYVQRTIISRLGTMVLGNRSRMLRDIIKCVSEVDPIGALHLFIGKATSPHARLRILQHGLEHGRVENFKALLDIGIRRRDECSAICHGLRAGKPDLFSLLLTHGMVEDGRNLTLQMAGRMDMTGTLWQCLAKRLTPRAMEEALKYGLQHGTEANLRLLLRTGVTRAAKEAALPFAVERATPNNFRLFLTHRLDEGARQAAFFEPRRWLGFSATISNSAKVAALKSGMKEGAPENFAFLLADTTLDSQDREDILEETVHSASVENFRALFESGISEDAKYHALYCAIEAGRTKVFLALLEEGLPEGSIDGLFECAVEQNQVRIVEALLDHSESSGGAVQISLELIDGLMQEPHPGMSRKTRRPLRRHLRSRRDSDYVIVEPLAAYEDRQDTL